MEMSCKKCNKNNWVIWTSSSSGKTNRYCKNCRQVRARSYTERKDKAVGSHTNKQWEQKREKYNVCPKCERLWDEIASRPDKGYKYVWTKDHITPLSQGGNDSIENIQPLCYQCNFGKR